MTPRTISALEKQFKNECKIINLKYEYKGYTGKEKWAIISDLTESEIIEKYIPFVQEYIPFIVLPLYYEDICNEYRRNENKHFMRASRSIEPFNYEDGEMEQHHPELVSNLLEESFFRSEKERELRIAISKLKLIQRERLIKYYFEGQNTHQIADNEGVSHQTVSNSISSALKNLKKLLM